MRRDTQGSGVGSRHPLQLRCASNLQGHDIVGNADDMGMSEDVPLIGDSVGQAINPFYPPEA